MDPLDIALDRIAASLDRMEKMMADTQDYIAGRIAELESDAYQELALAEVKAA